MGPIQDYGREHELLQFIFDVHVYRKVALARRCGRNAESALELVHWVPRYWEHHAAVVQVGLI